MLLRAVSLHQLAGHPVHVYENSAFFLGSFARGGQIFAVRLYQAVALGLEHLGLARLVVLPYGVGHFGEVAPDDRAAYNRCRALLSCLASEAAKILHVVPPWLRVAGRVGFLVVVAKLYYHVVAFRERVAHGVPSPLINETLGRAAVHGVVVHHDGAVEPQRQHLPPPALLIAFGQRLVGHGRVANHVYVLLGHGRVAAGVCGGDAGDGQCGQSFSHNSQSCFVKIFDAAGCSRLLTFLRESSNLGSRYVTLCDEKEKKIGRPCAFALIYLLSWHSISDVFRGGMR